LSYLGWNLVVVYATRTDVYNYKDLEFSLVEIQDFGYNFEIEILTSPSNVEDARKKILNICNEFGIKNFDNEGLQKQCNLMNNTKTLQYDLRTINFNDIKKRFRFFFRDGN
jgi:adenylate cyclase class IV